MLASGQLEKKISRLARPMVAIALSPYLANTMGKEKSAARATIAS
jgi:hypothetical protein